MIEIAASIQEAFEKINKAKLVKNLVLLKGYKKGTIDVAFSRGAISKELAPDLEELTTISALFWMRPDLYKLNGDRR